MRFRLSTALIAAIVIAPAPASAQRHPGIFISPAEAAAIRTSAAKYPLMKKTLDEAKAVVEHALANPTDVPQPGEAGGYAHERHKQNYREMQVAGVLYSITGDQRYARFVRDMLEKYAILYPTLGAHPLAKNQAPGKLFHQSLNEANWLVAVSIAYDCVYDYLKPAERARIEGNVLRPMADWLSVNQAKEFDRIHNHGTWATASVGMLGYVLGDTSYVNRALYGTKRDKTGGFLRQLDLLFSPDGYYMEGPYYIRYALLPFFQFAEAIQREQPGLRIYAYRDSILKKAVYSAIQTSLPNGRFPAINDASRTMAIDAPEVILALDLAYARYGANPNLLGGAAIQNEVIMNGAGLAVARDMAAQRSTPQMSWSSVEFTDGPRGDEGGLGILRKGKGQDASMLLMKYGVHGEGHGHFDQLHFIFYDSGREVVPDYGFSRWINIEPKFGGRYLPENDSYAMQTIAHNTVVVDETSQVEGKEDAADKVSGQRNFFSTSNPSVQVVSARSDKQYPGIGMQRTMFLIDDARVARPVVVDLYRLTSNSTHTYDYALHFRGQLIATDVKYQANTGRQEPLGKGFGYQHIWNEGMGTSTGPTSMTWLEGNRYYTITTAAGNSSRVIFGRTGANDPNFDLISEPMMIVRRKSSSELFASVIEPHGYFSESEEISLNATPLIQSIRIVANTAEATIAEVYARNDLLWTIMVANGSPSSTASHKVTAGGQTYTWTGNYKVEGVKPR
jgi:hypothetical protein